MPRREFSPELGRMRVDFNKIGETEAAGLIERIQAMGGEIVKKTFPWENIYVPEDLDLSAEIDERSFRSEVKDRLNTAWSTELWHITLVMTAGGRDEEILAPVKERNVINIDKVIAAIRSLEEGHYNIDTPWRLGAKTWDALAEILNSRLKRMNSTDLILPWDKNIHPALTSYDASEDRLESAVNKLQENYATSRQQWLHERDNPTLF